MIAGKSYHQILVLISVLFAQIFTPKLFFGFGYEITPDIFLIYLTYLSLIYSRFNLIIFGFLLGLTQDVISQANLFGLFAFSKTIIGFLLGTLNRFEKIWRKNIKILFLLLTYQFHFAISSYLMFERTITPLSYIYKTSLFQGFVLLCILFIVNKFILIDNKVIR